MNLFYGKSTANLLASVALVLASTPALAIDATVAPKAIDAVNASANDAANSAPRKGGLLGSIFGCAASGNKQTIGAAAGAAIGGLAGNRIAGSGSRTIGTILGGALGAAAGSALGCKLQKNEQAKAERATEEALAKNQNQTWKNDETGASGTVEVSSGAATGAALSNTKFAKGVEPASGFTKIGAAYTATATANIRSAPATKASSLGKLAVGQSVWVPASVKGQPWMLVSEKGIARGYVSAPLLKRAAVNVASASGCKTVKQTVSTPGSDDQSETLQACKNADGEWVMTQV